MKRRTQAGGWALAIAALLGGWGASALGAVGRIPGQFSVGASGAAQYTIPITVATGVNGLTPAIALAYSSQAGNVRLKRAVAELTIDKLILKEVAEGKF